MKKIFYFILFFALLTAVSAQSVNIVPALKEIEAGDISSAKNELNSLKRSNPDHPSVIFLDAVLTENGEDALNKYLRVYKEHPNSKYADASLFRIFSYYYSLGVYKRAGNLLDELKAKYPGSPYIKMADRNIPNQDFTVTEQPKPEEKPEAVKKQEKPEKPKPSYKWTVQAGAFLKINNAKSLRDELIEKGYPSEINTKEVGGSLLNIVTAGKFETKNEAEELLSLLKNNFNLNGRIKPLSK
jgi:predicted Zn-dependent protease